MRPSSRSAWLLFIAMAIATAGVVLLGHDAAGADSIDPVSGGLVPVTASITDTSAPPAAPAIDLWAAPPSSIDSLDAIDRPTLPTAPTTPPPSSYETNGSSRPGNEGGRGAHANDGRTRNRSATRRGRWA